jgi:hypothetical protein
MAKITGFFQNFWLARDALDVISRDGNSAHMTFVRLKRTHSTSGA